VTTADPVAMPVTMPEVAPTDNIEGSLLVQLPPTGLLRVIVWPVQTFEGPVTKGPLTVTIKCA
jgi:hypothetical protein